MLCDASLACLIRRQACFPLKEGESEQGPSDKDFLQQGLINIRMIEELKYLDENWVIKDPSIFRRYRHWLRIHEESIDPDFDHDKINFMKKPYSLN